MKARIQDGVVYSPYKAFELLQCSLFTFIEGHLKKYGEKTAVVRDSQSSYIKISLRLFTFFSTGRIWK